MQQLILVSTQGKKKIFKKVSGEACSYISLAYEALLQCSDQDAVAEVTHKLYGNKDKSGCIYTKYCESSLMPLWRKLNG